MVRTPVRLGLAALAALALAGCESTKSANPLSPTVAGPIPGVSITAPKPLEPGQGAQYRADKQPITLMIENASTTGVRPISYLFELAADAGFRTVLFTRDGVTPGDGGRTSLRLADKLASGHTYYWRARAQDGANTGPYSNAVSFTVLQPVTIDPPALVSPVGGETVDTNPMQMRWRNSERTGPAGPIVYTLQVARNQSFSSMAYTETTPEQSGDTRATPPRALEDSTTFYWRVRASDGSVQSDWSHTATFVTPADAPTPPPPPPSGGGGGGGGGNPGSCASRDGDYIVECIENKYPKYLRAGVSSSQRKANMAFLRDRIIEAGICGGLDLGWNMKRGGPEKSIDFIAERKNGRVYGYDIARDYDNTRRELDLVWQEDGPGSHWGGYSPRPSCN